MFSYVSFSDITYITYKNWISYTISFVHLPQDSSNAMSNVNITPFIVVMLDIVCCLIYI
jgi:hypothetical protein